jgi:hypothetical protein
MFSIVPSMKDFSSWIGLSYTMASSIAARCYVKKAPDFSYISMLFSGAMTTVFLWDKNGFTLNKGDTG